MKEKTLDNLHTMIEMLKAEIEDSVDRQETQTDEDYERGREYEAKYCLELIEKIFGVK